MASTKRNYWAGGGELHRHYLELPCDEAPDGIWVDLKRRLGYGDQKRLETSVIKGLTDEQIEAAMASADQSGSVQFDFAAPAVQKVAMYLADWNLPGPDGTPIELPRDVRERIAFVEELDSDIGDELAGVIDTLITERRKVATAPLDGPEAEGNPTPPPDSGTDTKRRS